MAFIPNYFSKQNPIEPLNAKKVAGKVWFYIFYNAFPASLNLKKKKKLKKLAKEKLD